MFAKSGRLYLVDRPLISDKIRLCLYNGDERRAQSESIRGLYFVHTAMYG